MKVPHNFNLYLRLFDFRNANVIPHYLEHLAVEFSLSFAGIALEEPHQYPCEVFHYCILITIELPTAEHAQLTQRYAC